MKGDVQSLIFRPAGGRRAKCRPRQAGSRVSDMGGGIGRGRCCGRGTAPGVGRITAHFDCTRRRRALWAVKALAQWPSSSL
ncbi:hypothetical protein GQ53DRAFT_379807 [Thozetella sp. PMI_491]|nr:hypothetical protein GQ53DRAFT_379807 [Thozetella sp. PMI_491]